MAQYTDKESILKTGEIDPELKAVRICFPTPSLPPTPLPPG